MHRRLRRLFRTKKHGKLTRDAVGNLGHHAKTKWDFRIFIGNMDKIFANKSLGQHWLVDLGSLEYIVEFSDLSKNDFVLEIGPGHGALTQYLVKKVDQVLAVEFDEKLAKSLKSKINADNLSVVNSDILSFDYNSLPENYKIVANIPYYLTSNLIRQITEADNLPNTVVLLIQKEVAERIAGKEGDMSLLSLAAKIYFDVQLGEVVKAECFDPAPKVDSQVIKLTKLSTQNIPNEHIEVVFRLAKMAFNSKRKTLLNSFSGGLGVDKKSLHEIQQKNNDVDFSARPQNLDCRDWLKLSEIFQKEGLIS